MVLCYIPSRRYQRTIACLLINRIILKYPTTYCHTHLLVLEIAMRCPSCLRLAFFLATLCLGLGVAAIPADTRASSSNIRVYLPLMSRTTAAISIEQQVADLTNQQR